MTTPHRAAPGEALPSIADAAAEPAATREALRRAREQRDRARAQVAALAEELEQTNRGLIALHMEFGHTRASEAKLVAIVRSAVDAILSIAPDGTIETWNAGAERLFGYAPDQIIGRGIDTLIPPELDESEPVRSSGRAGGAGERYETRRRHRDGYLVDVAVTLSEMRDRDGTPIGYAVLMHDITDRLRRDAERAQLEEEVHQSRRLQSVGQLAAGIAHDFNNLLGAMTGFAGFVDDALRSAVAEDGPRWQPVRDDLMELQRAAERAADLVHQLLAVGRRDMRQPRVFDLNRLATDLESLLRRAVGEHIDLRFALQPDLPLIEADPRQVEQILVNLAVNARDAMSGGGTLTVRTGVAPAEDARGDGVPMVDLAIADTGIGMDEETQSRAFEPFFTTKAPGVGTGLGLATVYGIVAQTGGETRIESSPGAGTTITASFPTAPDGPPAEG